MSRETEKNRRFFLRALLIVLFIINFSDYTSIVSAKSVEKPVWQAKWISYPGITGKEAGVYHFRKNLDLKEKPDSFVIHVSGDSRYQLFVNGNLVSFGPAKSDITHWKYETVDIAKFLKEGNNIIASTVWNFGDLNPISIFSLRTAFIIQGNTVKEKMINTDTSWKCYHNTAYQLVRITDAMVNGYYAAGPSEIFDANMYPWNWETYLYDDSGWENASVVSRADLRSDRWTGIWPAMWMLEKSEIPPMELKDQRILQYRLTEGIKIPKNFPSQKTSFTIKPYSKVKILLDQTFVTTAFPVIEVNKGKNAKITLAYSESLFFPGTHDKGNRDVIKGKEFKGLEDVFICDGKERAFKTLDWRAFRYLELTIETQKEALEFSNIYGIFTAYPFKMKAEFNANSKELDKILEVGWRTARVCAHETYMDTPYYERLQYAGDTRIQGLISIYNTGDTRLLKKAIQQLNNSRIPEGLTYSRYPSNVMQLIPPFSLWWIGMVHDYWMYNPDEQFVKEMLPGVRSVLSFFHSYQAKNGSVENLPYWNFMDWTKDWDWGIPVTGGNERTASIDILLFQAYLWAADMENRIGNKGMSEAYSSKAAKLKTTIFELYFNKKRGLFADTEKKDFFSEQTNTLAITSGLVDQDLANKIMKIMLSDTTLNQCTSYFQYYFNAALRTSGYGNQYFKELDEWRDQLDLGLTTWRETPEPSRSDCHAWSSSPNIELYRTVLGIRSGAPGYQKILIEPFPGDLKNISGSVPHPNGKISVSINKLKNNRTAIQIVLPKNIDGELLWKGERYHLSGKTDYSFEL
jgi:hypothetical protein